MSGVLREQKSVFSGLGFVMMSERGGKSGGVEGRRYDAVIRRAESAARRDALHKRWSHKQGAPETHERIAVVPSHRRQSPIKRMEAIGTIDSGDAASAEEIAGIVEMIERNVGVRSASLEARVDNSGSARDALVESLGRIRLEVAYRAWREAIPAPKRMIIDMIVGESGYVQLARVHRLHWRTARKRLITALRMWPEFRRQACDQVEAEDVLAAYARLGEGALLPPKVKPTVVGRIEDE